MTCDRDGSGEAGETRHAVRPEGQQPGREADRPKGPVMTPPQSPEAIELARLHEAATPGPWGIWFEQINGMADKAISELIDQVHSTDPIGNSLVMLDAEGKCPAITGCGPASAANAALIVALRNNLPRIIAGLDLLATQEAMVNEAFGLETGDE